MKITAVAALLLAASAISSEADRDLTQAASGEKEAWSEFLAAREEVTQKQAAYITLR